MQNNINMIYFTKLLVLFYLINNVYCNYNNNYLKIRNYTLSIVILKDINKARLFIKNGRDLTKNIYNKMINVYYDTSYKYYSLSDDERELLDNIVSLCY